MFDLMLYLKENTFNPWRFLGCTSTKQYLAQGHNTMFLWGTPRSQVNHFATETLRSTIIAKQIEIYYENSKMILCRLTWSVTGSAVAQWQSACLEIEGLRVRVSPASLCCVHEHINPCLVLVQPRKTRPGIFGRSFTEWLTICKLGMFSCFCCRLLILFKINYFKKKNNKKHEFVQSVN